MVELEGKRILLFSPYGCTKHYGVAIKGELEKRGASVDEYDERPSEKSIMKIIIRLFKKKVPQIFNQYIQNIVSENAEKNYDYILICRGEAFTSVSINSLRSAFPNAKIILYLWDVMHSCPMGEVIPYCDKAMTFDPKDAKLYNIGFRPTFYVNDYLDVKDVDNFEYDIEFVCTLYPIRRKMVKFLKDFFTTNNIRFFMYLYVPGFIKYIHDSILSRPFFSFREINLSPISIPATVDLLNKSRCILDINPPFQVSLSTRAHESIAARRKYITTNKHIMDYEYYNPNNMLVIDIDNPLIPTEFLQTSYEPVDDKILYKYSVAGLVDDLFEGV